MNDKNSQTQKYNLVLTRVFDASTDRVWAAWTQPEYVKQWWGPKGFTCPVANMNVREGGRSLVCMRAPQEYGGQDMYNTWTYSKVLPNERLDYILKFTDRNGKILNPADIGLPPGIPGDVPHEITFKETRSGKTEVTVKEFGYETEEVVEQSKKGMEQCLDKMAVILDKYR